MEHLEKYLADDCRQAAELKEKFKDCADLNNRQIDILLESSGGARKAVDGADGGGAIPGVSS